MQKHKVNVPSVEEFSQPTSRKGFFKALAVAGMGAAVGSTVLAGRATAQDDGGGDLEIANFALTLEYLEAEFYQLALDAGVLSEPALSQVAAVGDHENQHVEALIGLITEAGGTPVEKPEFTFPADAFTSEASILALASTFEPVGVGAYLGAGVLIQDPAVLAAAGSIVAVEGQHVVAFNNLLGVVPPANDPFPAALTQDEVLAAIAPFLGMDAMMDTGGQAL
ncbi:ferritin-like domain-containing protein [Rubrobacter indicoceani]|uniref:ferritin-like domain-containing protein n=1 Tax=Rubrobacter indicoceani TaxID=2051957 RepID=UPI000E5A48F0|nr:ferritin-like domain-containing protein [Rubrobacter indicoceani]